MKAAVFTDYGAPVEIAEVPRPELQDDSVLIEVHAASLNPIDNILRAGYMRQMMELNLPHVTGYDVSGTVIEVGKTVRKVKVGDAVFARQNQQDAGAVAEIARIQESDLALKPANVSHEHAASAPLAGLTAWQALVTKGKIKAGDKVLIHAGSGGVGTYAIQLAKHFGATVATTTSGKNAALVTSLGADVVIDYTKQNFEDVLADYDLVVDTMGGDILARSFKVLKKGGTLVSIKGQDTDGLAAKYGVTFEWFFMSPDGAMLAELGALISDGTVRPIIDSVYPMAKVQDACDRLATGRAVGKVIVTVK